MPKKIKTKYPGNKNREEKGEKVYEKNYEETQITYPDSMASGNRNVIRICATGSQPEGAEPN